MRKIKVGILTFSDGRKYIHEDLYETNQRYQNRLAAALEKTSIVETVQGEEIIPDSRVAQREGRRMAEAGCDLTIFGTRDGRPLRCAPKTLPPPLGRTGPIKEMTITRSGC